MEFHTLPRRDLQSLCKKNRIPANLSNLAMADALCALDAVEGIEEVLQSPQKPETLSPELPRTGRRTAAAAKERQASPLPRSRRVTAKAVEEIAEEKVEVLEEKPETETPGVRAGRRARVVPTPVTAKAAVGIAEELVVEEKPESKTPGVRAGRRARVVPTPVAAKAAVEIAEEKVVEEKPETETPGVRAGRRARVVPTPVAVKAAVEIAEEKVVEEKPETETPGVRTGRRARVVPTPVTRPVTRTRVSKKAEEITEAPVTGRKSVKKAEEAVVKTGRSTRGRAAAKISTLVQESEDGKVSTRRTRSKGIRKMASLVQDIDEPESQDGGGGTEVDKDCGEIQLEEVSGPSIEVEIEKAEDNNLDSENVEETEEAHEEEIRGDGDLKLAIDDESPIRGLVEQNQEEDKSQASAKVDIEALPEMKVSGDVLLTDQAAGELDVAAEADVVFDVPAPTESDVTMLSESAILDDVSSQSPVAPSPEIFTEPSLSPIKESSESALLSPATIESDVLRQSAESPAAASPSPVVSSPDVITQASLSPSKESSETGLLSPATVESDVLIESESPAASSPTPVVSSPDIITQAPLSPTKESSEPTLLSPATITSDVNGEILLVETKVLKSESPASSSPSPVVSSPIKKATVELLSSIGSALLSPATVESAVTGEVLAEETSIGSALLSPATVDSDVTGEVLAEEAKVFGSESATIPTAAAAFSSSPEKFITEVTVSPVKDSVALLPTIEDAEDSDLLSPAIIESDVTVEKTKVFEAESATILNAAAASPFLVVTNSPEQAEKFVSLSPAKEAEVLIPSPEITDSAISPVKETFVVDTLNLETERSDKTGQEIDAPVQEAEGEMKLDLCSDIVVSPAKDSSITDPDPTVEQISEKLGGLEIDLGNNKENNAGEKKVKNTDRKPVLFERLSMRKLKVIYKEKLISMKNTKNEECNKVEVRRTALSALDKNQQ